MHRIGFTWLSSQFVLLDRLNAIISEKPAQLSKYTTSIAALEQQVVLYDSIVFPDLTLSLAYRLLHKCTRPYQSFHMLEFEAAVIFVPHMVAYHRMMRSHA